MLTERLTTSLLHHLEHSIRAVELLEDSIQQYTTTHGVSPPFAFPFTLMDKLLWTMREAEDAVCGVDEADQMVACWHKVVKDVCDRRVARARGDRMFDDDR